MMIKPTIAGQLFRDPHTKRVLPQTGGKMPDSTFWRRRLAAGDVEIIDEPTPPTGREPVTPLTTRGPR